MLSRADKREKLRLLREARRTGGRIQSDPESEDDKVYDEVDENTYIAHKRNQLMNDDFIVDDDGEGYVDNGVDEWDDSSRPQYYSDEEAPDKKRKRDKPAAKVAKTALINNFFKPASGIAPKLVETNIDDILEGFDVEVPIKKQKKEKNLFAQKPKKTKNPFSFSTVTKKERTVKLEEDISLDVIDIDQPLSPIKLQSEDEKPIKLEAKPVEEEEEDDDSEDDVVVTKRPRTAVQKKTTISNFSSVKVTAPLSSPLRAAQEEISYTKKLEASTIVDESDTTFKMFWLDYCEVDGSLLLFGKVITKDGSIVSGIVQVQGLVRELYFLPRKFRKAGEEIDESEPVTAKDVHDEVVPFIMTNYDLLELKAKPETMKYAFEIPGVPHEAEYLKILLPFKTNKLQKEKIPSTLEGETFSRVFGGNAGILESFLIQRNVMGPCWLEISGGNFNAIQNTSHCQVEVSVSSPDCITPMERPLPAPPLTVTSISVQTLLNKNKQEVVSISLATYKDIPQDAPIDERLQPNELVTLVRPVGGVAVPPGLKQLAEKQNLNLRTFPNEKVLLNCLSALIKSSDPDIFVGHKLENISLDVIVHRMHDLKIPTWSTLGRRNRKVWPSNFGTRSAFANTMHIREIFQGRLLCDIANELGQSLTPKCQSWDLAEMYQVACTKKTTLLDINFANPQYADDAALLMMACQENAKNVHVTAEIAFAVQIFSLLKQLTNIAGNAWSHTLSGTRAGRNEYILLHEFRQNKYIVPDKEDKYNKTTNHQQQARMEANDDDTAAAATSNKKPKFQGGLVFEPEKGLHKNYSLVMDFNSLYPSIIQEFNICFTTVDRDAFNTTHDEDRDMPALPEDGALPGVLPRLLNTLVTRRREVKKLLKDPKNTPFQRAQYDIKQQALKLTANSMYGCLGYVNSRFYAKPLAMMVTSKGREILMDTRQLAELIGLRVLYGDTDSVMIDTGTDSFADAVKVGDAFKIQVNDRYKLLEIDIDNVYKRILLHAKKKYAAMNCTIDKKTGLEVTTLEVKGLDMRRREYCQLSKDTSAFVLDKILSDLDPEQALQDVYQYLEETSSKVKANEFRMDKYNINNMLSKDPDMYPNGKTMPQIQVAKRMREEGKVVKAGSVITFVITAKDGDEDKRTPADRARSFQEVMKNTSLKPDPDHYLEKQILAPIERILQLIEGVDMVRVASSLGIDTRKYIMRTKNGENSHGEIAPLESSISDAERFRTSSYLVLHCKCGSRFRFGGLQLSNDYSVTSRGVSCTKCKSTMSPLKMNSQLEVAIRTHISCYYAGWLVCDDGACGLTTRQISVYGKRCIGLSGKAHGCKGIMRYKYSDKALYNQLLYFDSLFDVDKAKQGKLRPVLDTEAASVPELPTGQVTALAEQNRTLFELGQEVVQKYLSDCGRRYVNMGSIFDFMTV